MFILSKNLIINILHIMDTEIEYSKFMNPIFLFMSNERLQNMYRNSMIKLANFSGGSMLIYLIGSILLLIGNIMLLVQCLINGNVANKIMGIICLSLVIISPLLEILLITIARKILFCKGIFYLISIEFSSIALTDYGLSINVQQLNQIRSIDLEFKY